MIPPTNIAESKNPGLAFRALLANNSKLQIPRQIVAEMSRHRKIPILRASVTDRPPACVKVSFPPFPTFRNQKH